MPEKAADTATPTGRRIRRRNGDFVILITGESEFLGYKLSRMKNATGLVMITDSINVSTGNTIPQWIPAWFLDDNSGIHTIHKGRANVAFADGHTAGMTAQSAPLSDHPSHQMHLYGIQKTTLSLVTERIQ